MTKIIKSRKYKNLNRKTFNMQVTLEVSFQITVSILSESRTFL